MLTAEIDLGAIKDNALYIKKRVKTEVYAVVKTDAYGHGAVRVAKYIENVVDGFAVATDFEALELTDANIKKPILILDPELNSLKTLLRASLRRNKSVPSKMLRMACILL